MQTEVQPQNRCFNNESLATAGQERRTQGILSHTKAEHVEFISKARDPERTQRIQRATQTRRYPILCGVVDHSEQHRAELQKIREEADAFMQAKKVVKKLQNCQYRLATLTSFRRKMCFVNPWLHAS